MQFSSWRAPPSRYKKGAPFGFSISPAKILSERNQLPRFSECETCKSILDDLSTERGLCVFCNPQELADCADKYTKMECTVSALNSAFDPATPYEAKSSGVSSETANESVVLIIDENLPKRYMQALASCWTSQDLESTRMAFLLCGSSVANVYEGADGEICLLHSAPRGWSTHFLHRNHARKPSYVQSSQSSLTKPDRGYFHIGDKNKSSGSPSWIQSALLKMRSKQSASAGETRSKSKKSSTKLLGKEKIGDEFSTELLKDRDQASGLDEDSFCSDKKKFNHVQKYDQTESASTDSAVNDGHFWAGPALHDASYVQWTDEADPFHATFWQKYSQALANGESSLLAPHLLAKLNIHPSTLDSAMAAFGDAEEIDQPQGAQGSETFDSDPFSATAGCRKSAPVSPLNSANPALRFVSMASAIKIFDYLERRAPEVRPSRQSSEYSLCSALHLAVASHAAISVTESSEITDLTDRRLQCHVADLIAKQSGHPISFVYCGPYDVDVNPWASVSQSTGGAVSLAPDLASAPAAFAEQRLVSLGRRSWSGTVRVVSSARIRVVHAWGAIRAASLEASHGSGGSSYEYCMCVPHSDSSLTVQISAAEIRPAARGRGLPSPLVIQTIVGNSVASTIRLPQALSAESYEASVNWPLALALALKSVFSSYLKDQRQFLRRASGLDTWLDQAEHQMGMASLARRVPLVRELWLRFRRNPAAVMIADPNCADCSVMALRFIWRGLPLCSLTLAPTVAIVCETLAGALLAPVGAILVDLGHTVLVLHHFGSPAPYSAHPDPAELCGRDPPPRIIRCTWTDSNARFWFAIVDFLALEVPPSNLSQLPLLTPQPSNLNGALGSQYHHTNQQKQ